MIYIYICIMIYILVLLLFHPYLVTWVNCPNPHFWGIGLGLNEGTTWKTASTSLRMGSSGGATCIDMGLGYKNCEIIHDIKQYQTKLDGF
jgi:hypothetical protein